MVRPAAKDENALPDALGGRMGGRHASAAVAGCRATNRNEPDPWDLRIRVAFWVIGIFSGGLLSYTTRHFINGDAIAYIEMGETLRTGWWGGLANLTYSPGYPVLLGLGQILINTNPLNELQLLRVVNFACFVLAMGACDLLMGLVRRQMGLPVRATEQPLPWFVLSAPAYGMFLVASLLWVRLRLITPDMLVLAFVVTSVAIVLWIREEPSKYARHVLLGIITGLAYLTKSFFFTFSPILFGLAGLVCGSLKRAIPRVLVAVAVMLVISAPLIGALSSRMGRFSYGELGGLAYALWISGQGESINPPEVVHEKPRVAVYRYDVPCTQPSGHDICYWYVGFGPKWNLQAHAKVILENVPEFFVQTPWLVLIILWFIFQLMIGSFRVGRLWPASTTMVLLIPALLGTGFFFLIRVEPRYVAPFLFIGFLGLASGLRYPFDNGKARRKAVLSALALAAFFVGLVVHSLVDQSLSGLHSTPKKLSYQAAFLERVAVKDFLAKSGLSKGDEVAVVGRRPPIYWARMAGVRIVGEVTEPEEFLSCSREGRDAAIDSLRKEGLKAVVAKGPEWTGLAAEGWRLVPGTRDYYALVLNER